MSRNLIIIGLVLVGVGLLWPWISKLPLGRLPGDIIIKRDGFRLFFPITSCLLVSGILSFLFWLFRK
ncbi:DUF2905 domain-containing protein [Desulfopila sp. IMCC35008]|uniref:DUF2905 domain-containing protein n=1 Tax=Desulfopila sp. IMCC35008 TaxID=2653858 RepID=UPI0013D2247C|nr:DUF2905 domain-containing protein [Desulfopila sp. IMCC35008]